MGVWTYANDGSRTIGICTNVNADEYENCEKEKIYFLILFGVTFCLFALVDVAPINMWAIPGDCNRLRIIITELFLCAIVALFCADVGLDLIRTHVNFHSVLWHAAWLMPFVISLVARIPPCLICCLPLWARSHQARANHGERSFAVARSRSGRDIDIPNKPTPSDNTNATKSKQGHKSAKQKFKDKRLGGNLRRSKTRRTTLTALPAVFGSQYSGQRREEHAAEKRSIPTGRSTPTMGRVSTVTSIDEVRWGHAKSANLDLAIRKHTSCCCACDRDVCCWCFPHPLAVLRYASHRLSHLLHILFSGTAWDLYETYSALLSIASVYIYLHGTYETSSYRVRVSDTGDHLPTVPGFRPAWKEDCPAETENPWTHWPQQYIECGLIIDWVLRLLVTRKSKIRKLLSPYMLSDLMSISMIPVWLLGFPPELYRSFGCLRFLRLLRLSTHYALKSKMSKIQLKKWRKVILYRMYIYYKLPSVLCDVATPTQRRAVFQPRAYLIFSPLFLFSFSPTLAGVYMIVTSLFMVTAGLILTVEYGEESGFICFHDALYFSVVSLLTVGLGDLAPISATGRILSTLMLVVGVALVSYQLNELEAANNRQARFRYTGSLKSSVERHVILCGDVMHVDSVKVFLEEFCHPNHRGTENQRLPTIILMCPNPPSTELEHLMEVMMSRDRRDGQRTVLQYMQGLPSSVRDLHRVGGKCVVWRRMAVSVS